MHWLKLLSPELGLFHDVRTGSRVADLLGCQSFRKTFAVAGRELGGMNADANPNPEKPPEQWVTGQEPMTGPQISYLRTLCREAGEEFDETLSKAEASKKIDELQTKTGRGKAPQG
jgi:hypothetical protein